MKTGGFSPLGAVLEAHSIASCSAL